MARCVRKESEARRIFYGSMIAEGIIALIWAAAVVVNEISGTLLGK